MTPTELQIIWLKKLVKDGRRNKVWLMTSQLSLYIWIVAKIQMIFNYQSLKTFQIINKKRIKTTRI